MAYAKIPEKEAALLVRALGLLVNQAGIYGAAHNVTQLATRSVFSELEQVIKTCGPVEIALKDAQVLVNGSSEGLEAAAGKNLADRMALHKVGGIIFLAPPDRAEFSACITLFGTPPQVLADGGGFEAALKKAGLRSVRAVTVAYQRVAGDAPPPPSAEAGAAPPAAAPVQRRPAAAPEPEVLDLSAALCGSGGEGDGDGAASPESGGQNGPRSAARHERASALASLLRDTAALLETEEEGRPVVAVSSEAVMAALEQIRGVLAAMTAESERHITHLACQVDEDSQTIASIESAARRRGIGLKLTRGELIQQYAELNQEIVQPLTVSTGVLGMLSSGHAGRLTASQQNLLKLAEDSVQRVNQLVAYMNRISGLPDSFTPNSGLIADTYR